MHSKEEIISEIRDLGLKQIPSRETLNDYEHLRIHRGLILLDELIEELYQSWGLRDLPDALIQKAFILSLLGRYNESHECLLEAYSLEFRNSTVYIAMMALYRQMGALACAEEWMCSYIDLLYADQKS